MKTKALFVAIIISASCFLSLNSAHAQVEQIAMDTGKDIPQGPINNNGGVTITDVAKPFSITTKTLLQNLATDETAAGNWFAKYPNKVPPNAKLEIIYPYRTGFGSFSYRVVSGTNIISVTNILSATAISANALQSGTHIDTNGAEIGPFNYTVYQEFTITYDARPLGGKLWFQITGLATCSAKGGPPIRKSVHGHGYQEFLETDSFSLIDGTGAGADTNGTAFSLSGVAVTAMGSGQVGRLQGSAVPEPPNSSTGEEFSTGAGDEQIYNSTPPSIAPNVAAPHDATLQIAQPFALTIGAEFHQSPTVDKKGVTTINPPTRSTFNTATLLKYLAKDETLANAWFPNFDNKAPPGAKLEALFAGVGVADFGLISFHVVHGTDIVDVSNILSAAPADTNYIADVGFNDADQFSVPPYYAIILRRYTLTYDARPFGDSLNFFITAMATTDVIGTKPTAKGVYTEADAFGLGYGSGFGVDSTGAPFLLTGVGLAATGKEKLNDGNSAPGGGKE